MLEQVFSGSVKKHTLDVIPIFFWIADGREAIFSFPSIRAGEYGFLTTDQQLIRGLLDTEELFNKGSNDAGSKPR